MKINGMVFDGPKPQPCVIPVGDTQIAFMITPVLEDEEFLTLYPRPTPPKGRDNKGKETINVEHPTYLDALGKWGTTRMNWLYLKALERTEGLEWETIKMDDPSTYANLDVELKQAGIPEGYIDALKYRIIQVCGLDPDRIEEATKRFLADRELAQNA